MSIPNRMSTNYGWPKNFSTLSSIMLGLKALVDAIDAKFYARGYDYLRFDIPATELAAGTTIERVCPVAGKIVGMTTIIQTAIVTGGAVTVKVGTTDVTGLSITVTDAATKGTVQTDAPTSDGTDVVTTGSRIQIVPAAAFNGGGAVSGFLKIQIA